MQQVEATSAYGAWRQICRVTRSHVSPRLFRSCFAGTTGVGLRRGVLTVAVPTQTARDQLEGRFGTVLAMVTRRLWQHALEVRFAVTQPLVPSRVATMTRSDAAPIAAGFDAWGMALNPRYTFETFVSGESNRLAFAASQSVASAPGQGYNPLFIYGGVGLGKTHLLMGIGHVATASGRRVRYITAEAFTNEIVEAIQEHGQEAFRQRYAAVDVLLVDDIQFIGGRERTEEEFFHIFNALHNANKQIVISSDRPPRNIPTLHDRLRSRFEWGLLADVTAPDHAHRVAILQAKAAQIALHVSPVILEMLARPEGSSVRQLEGALNRLAMLARMQDGAPTLAMAAATMRECFGERARLELSPHLVVDLVAQHYRVSTAEMLGKGRTRTVAWPRQVVMFLLREETEFSLAQIGTALGGRDHTTIMHGYDQVSETVRHDEITRGEVESLRAMLRSL